MLHKHFKSTCKKNVIFFRILTTWCFWFCIGDKIEGLWRVRSKFICISVIARAESKSRLVEKIYQNKYYKVLIHQKFQHRKPLKVLLLEKIHFDCVSTNKNMTPYFVKMQASSTIFILFLMESMLNNIIFLWNGDVIIKDSRIHSGHE